MAGAKLQYGVCYVAWHGREDERSRLLRCPLVAALLWTLLEMHILRCFVSVSRTLCWRTVGPLLGDTWYFSKSREPW